MIKAAIGSRLPRFAAVVVLAGLVVGCASSKAPDSMTAPPGFGKDTASRVTRLLQYCDRLAEKGEMVTALGLCARASELAPEDPEPLLKVAELLQTMNRKQAAVETYRVILQRNPNHHEAQYLLGKLYMEVGETDMASITFNHAMQSDPADPRPYNALGILRDQAGEHEAAQGLYRLALERDPKNRSVRNNLGLSLALNGKRDEAIEMLAELAVDPEAGQTVMRNLEAAYASRPVPQADTMASPSPMMEPVEPVSDPVTPIASEPVESPAEEAPMKAQDEMPRGHKPEAPEDGAPTPLFLPPAAKADEPPAQSGVLPTSDADEEPDSPAIIDDEKVDAVMTDGEPAVSAILQAAERLMQPPAWADFEPGDLLSEEPVSDAPMIVVPPSGVQGAGDRLVPIRPNVSMLLLGPRRTSA